MTESRNDRGEFLRKAAGVAGAVVLVGSMRRIFASTAEKDAGEIERMHNELQVALAKDRKNVKWMMGVDTRKCIGCDSCSVACAVENLTPVGTSFRKVYKEMTGEGNDLNQFFMPTNCQQCDVPKCLKAANSIAPGSIEKQEDGIVALNYEVLKKSKKAQKAAEKACPYHALVEEKGEFYLEGTPRSEKYESRMVFENGSTFKSKSELKGTCRKCTFCQHRLNSGMLPACVTSCIGRAMFFGDVNDPSTLISETFATSAYFLSLENKPRVAYLGYTSKEEISKISAESCMVCHDK